MSDIQLVREIKKIMQFFKRIALGKEAPSKYLRVLCWINITWSFLMILCLLFFVFLSNTELKLQTKGILSYFVLEMNALPFIIWGCFHALIIFSVVLIWRKKIYGLIIYCMASIAPTFYLYFLDVSMDELYVLFFSAIIFVILFLFRLSEFENNHVLDEE